jgi:uncharacterized membrane protein YgdD (TMEM256/DUF423 family)
MESHMQKLIAVGALILFIGVGLGAFGSHALKPLLILHQMTDIWETAVSYQMWHGLGILILGPLSAYTHQRLYMLAGWIMLLGVILFSGSLYLYAFTGIKYLGIVTPIGGVAFLIAWLLVLWGAITRH